MSDMRIFTGSSSVSRAGTDGQFIAARGLRGGELVVADIAQALVFEGRAFTINVGSFSTPITGGGAGTVLDLDQPEAVISVPSGTSIIPLRFHVQCQQPLAATDADESEVLIAVDRTAAWAVDGTYTAETALNLRTDNPLTSNCTCGSAFTADMTNTAGTDPVLGIELARSVNVADVQGTAANVVVTNHSLLYEPKAPPIIVGPAAVYVYWGGTVATPGFAQLVWGEIPTTAIS